MERTVLEESWRQNGPVGPSLEVVDDDDKVIYVILKIQFLPQRKHNASPVQRPIC
jgi:hypothetical protein